MHHFRDIDLSDLKVLLCDADGNLFPSEEPAFEASVGVTNRFLQRFGLAGDRTAEGLRNGTTGKNFRSTAMDLVIAGGVPVERALAAGRPDAVIADDEELAGGRALCAAELEEWVARERDAVTDHLGSALAPDPEVSGPLRVLGSRFRLIAVSSSATKRLAACFTAAGLDALIPPEVRFSAEDSLPRPTSKPDPAIYREAQRVMGLRCEEGLAIEDSVPGALSAAGAGFPTVGNVMFVPPAERADRTAQLRAAGACAVVESWWELQDLLVR
ncbi:HAD family phosphatase [Mycobacterium sp. MYCO198283]|uniref:HAD family hydrolase n=1 Tax=Mycobacterium sp. MYCO198283 TaxID=2883505 RepID=UPI001E612C2E|nr:HAD family hydrolase [Mycobacterium sp. MYCO198283]MCG5431104.1 HAD family phosphatase [Mycobacterium sp. MYCO198283]